MAKVFIEETSLTAIGDAIRAKTGGTEVLTVPAGMVNAIASITTGGGEVVDSHAWEDWRLSGTYDGQENYVMDEYVNDRITKLTEGAFLGAKIKRISLPNVEYVGASAFKGTNQTYYINIPKATYLGDYALQSALAYEYNKLNAPLVSEVGQTILANATYLKYAYLPSLLTLDNKADVFSYSNQLEVVDFPIVDHAGIGTVQGCGSLICVNMPKAKNIGWGAFQSCGNEKFNYLNFPGLERLSGGGSFAYMYNLKKIDLGQCQAIDSTNNFDGDSSLDTIVLRYDGVCTLAQDATSEFGATKIVSGTGYIYVPAAQVDAYKTATNWASVADQFRAIEDYEDELIIGCIYDESVKGTVAAGTYQGLLNICGMVLPNISACESSGGYAGSFAGCTNLRYVRLDKAITVGGLCNCGFLTRVEIPNCRTLTNYALAYSTQLKFLDLPNVTSVGTYAFAGTQLANIVLRSATKVSGTSNMFDKMNAYPTLWVPAALVDIYAADTNWNKCTIKAIEGSIYEEV